MTKSQQAQAEKICQERLKDNKSHFRSKDGGWPLSVRILVDEVVNTILGKDLFAFVLTRVVPPGCTVALKNDEFVIVRKKPRAKCKRSSKS